MKRFADRRRHQRIPPPSQRSVTEQSLADRFMGVLRAGGDVRESKVGHVRESVEQSDYENDLKLSVAIDRLSSEIECDQD